MKKILCIVLVALGLVVGGALPAHASSEYISGTVYAGQVVNYGTERTVTDAGSNIYFRKQDGPAIDLRWRRCAGGAVGNWVYFENPDPTARNTIGTDFISGAVFCLSSYSYGSNSTDTFGGTLDWNVFS